MSLAVGCARSNPSAASRCGRSNLRSRFRIAPGTRLAGAAFLKVERLRRCSLRKWPIATNFLMELNVSAFGSETEGGRAAEPSAQHIDDD